MVQTSLSNDQLQQVEPSEYQSLDQINQEEAHVYTDLHGQHNIYNEPGETSTSVNLIEHADNADNAEGVNVRSKSNRPWKENIAAACEEYVICDPQNDSADGTVTRNRRDYEKNYEEDGYLQPKSTRAYEQDYDVVGNLQPKSTRAYEQDYEVDGYLQPK